MMALDRPNRKVFDVTGHGGSDEMEKLQVQRLTGERVLSRHDDAGRSGEQKISMSGAILRLSGHRYRLRQPKPSSDLDIRTSATTPVCR